MMKSLSSEEAIKNCLKANFGIAIQNLTVLPIGADMDATIYKAEDQNESVYFVKLKHNGLEKIGLEILLLLQDAKIQQIVLPIKSKKGESFSRIHESDLIVYPFIKGQNGFHKALSEEQWVSFGKSMRQVHDIVVPIAIQKQLRQETYSDKWREKVKSLYSLFEMVSSVDEISSQLLMFIKQHLSTIYRLVNRAQELAKKVQNETSKLVLCHSDIHAGNILISDNQNDFYIIDWDDPIMAPKERDLMFIGGGVGNVWNKTREEKLFYEGYGKTEINKQLLAYYRYERIVEDIALYAQQLLLTTEGGEDRMRHYQHFVAMFEKNGVVDIAFKTDQGMNSIKDWRLGR